MCWWVDVLMCWCWWHCVDVVMIGWCVDVLMIVLKCRSIEVLKCWSVDVLMCWCVADIVLMCWSVDLLMLMCWRVDVLMIVLMTVLMTVLMCWWCVVDVCWCWCIDGLWLWCDCDVLVCWWLCWLLCYDCPCLDNCVGDCVDVWVKHFWIPKLIRVLFLFSRVYLRLNVISTSLHAFLVEGYFPDRPERKPKLPEDITWCERIGTPSVHIRSCYTVLFLFDELQCPSTLLILNLWFSVPPLPSGSKIERTWLNKIIFWFFADLGHTVESGTILVSRK